MWVTPTVDGNHWHHCAWPQYGTAGCILQLWTVAAAEYFQYVCLYCTYDGMRMNVTLMSACVQVDIQTVCKVVIACTLQHYSCSQSPSPAWETVPSTRCSTLAHETLAVAREGDDCCKPRQSFVVTYTCTSYSFILTSCRLSAEAGPTALRSVHGTAIWYFCTGRHCSRCTASVSTLLQ
jgi:hypothetical protein